MNNSLLPITRDYGPHGSLEAEVVRTAELLVKIADEQGIFYAVAFLHDMQYTSDPKRMKELMIVLQKEPGAIKPEGLNKVAV